MKRTFYGAATLIVAGVLLVAKPSIALDDANPGKSLHGVMLGSSRQRAIATVRGRYLDLLRAGLIRVKRRPPRKCRGGVVEDDWDIQIGQETSNFEILSRQGKVIQLRTWTSSEKGQTNLSFADLVQRHQLQKQAYQFDLGDQGGYEGFYYDDIKRGVCFSLGVQDDFLLTYHPDGIIVHRPGVPAIPIDDGVMGKRDTGPSSRAFANAGEADRIRDSERNDY